MPNSESTAPPTVLLVAGFAFAYYVAEWVGLRFYFEPNLIATLWPASGLFLAVLLIAPTRLWPVLVLTTVIVDLLRTSFGVGPQGTPSAVVAVSNAAEALAGAALVRGAVGGIPSMIRPRDVGFLVFGAGLLATALGALLGALTVAWEQPVSAFGNLWRVWWFSDALGVLAVTPFLLAWHAAWSEAKPWPSASRQVECAVLFGGLALALVFVFGAEPGPAGGVFDFPYVVVPFALWAALRFESRAVTTAALITAFSCVYFADQGRGPFIIEGQSVELTVLELQAFLVVNTLMPLVVSTLSSGERLAVDALRESENKFRSLVETTPDWVWEVDRRGRFSYSSPRVRDLLGYAPEEVVGQSMAALMNEADAAQFRDNLPERMNSPARFQNVERTQGHRDGHEVITESNASPYFGTDGELVGYRGIDRDIAKRKRAEAELELQRRELVEADKLISLGTLVSGVAHEINNPNHFIMLNLPILQRVWADATPLLDRHAEGDPDFRLANLPYAEAREEIPELLEEILGGADRIRGIVSELRDYSRRAEPGVTGPVDVNEVVRAGLTLLSNPIKKGTRHFSAELGEGLPPALGNDRRLEQVVINLILNALQSLSDPEGKVTVRTAVDAARGDLVIEVDDEGCGIEPDALAHIRDPFYTTKRDQGGTGLGLAVSSRIVEEHGGRLDYESEPGVGTIARLRVPAFTEGGGV